MFLSNKVAKEKQTKALVWLSQETSIAYRCMLMEPLERLLTDKNDFFNRSYIITLALDMSQIR